ncbi:MAG: DUF72 domain-containing protein [Planctomycetota bacterium]|jgi:uncharacterized protein YecE (DUF72 family)
MARVAKKLSRYLRIGTCSWKYDSWKGLIYDSDRKYAPDEYLIDYAGHYNTVEIDQWFWSLFGAGAKLPDPETVATYAESVGDDFLFTVKAPNSITLTHHYAKQSARNQHLANKPNAHFLDVDMFEKFLEILRPMGSKLGPIMLQFEYLNRQKMPSLKAFIEKLGVFFDHAPDGFEYAVEIRNPNYLKPAWFDFLKERGINVVLLEGHYMPPVAEVAEKFDISSGNVSIIRLMGPDRQKIEKQTDGRWDRIVSAKDDSLESVARIVTDHIEQTRRVTVNVNNHYEGCAVLTIDRLLDMLGPHSGR